MIDWKEFRKVTYPKLCWIPTYDNLEWQLSKHALPIMTSFPWLHDAIQQQVELLTDTQRHQQPCNVTILYIWSLSRLFKEAYGNTGDLDNAGLVNEWSQVSSFKHHQRLGGLGWIYKGACLRDPLLKGAPLNKTIGKNEEKSGIRTDKMKKKRVTEGSQSTYPDPHPIQLK